MASLKIPLGKDSRESSTYLHALDTCKRVAREEYDFASVALSDAEVISDYLLSTISMIVQSRPHNVAVAEDARVQLQKLETKLETTVSTLITDAKGKLAAKHESLHRFTVTLFGRTMAGKSTIREALTRGDGSTIGKGAQRTTRDIREYNWNSLRLIDTPGIGAYEGDSDRALALSVIDETDIVLFLLSSDGIQEDSFKGMQALRQQNKPILFVLNVKLDLKKSVFMRRFLSDPGSVFSDEMIRGHLNRIHKLAFDFLGIRNIRVVPIHAQAAYLSTRPEYYDISDTLANCSRIGNLLGELESEVLQRGTVRRVQTVVDGTVNSLLDTQEELREQAKIVKRAALYLKDKYAELDVWLDGFIRATNSRAESEAVKLFQPLRDNISSFVDENLERDDVDSRWKHKVKALKIDEWLARQQASILDELRGHLIEFSREMSFEAKLGSVDASGPTTYDPWDIKRTLRWASAGGAALAGIAGILAFFDDENGDFWDSTAAILGVASIVAIGLSWLFDDRESKLQKQKAKAAQQLRSAVDQLEQNVTSVLKKWFYENVTSRIVRGLRYDTKHLYNGMFDFARTLDDSSRSAGGIVERLNRRLLLRTGQFVGSPIPETRIGRVVRDPGIRSKFLWTEGHDDTRFCRQVGIAIGEWIDGIADGPTHQQIADALRPAIVSPENVNISGQSAIVHIVRSEIGRAIGKGGSNISLASRLMGLQIKICEENADD